MNQNKLNTFQLLWLMLYRRYRKALRNQNHRFFRQLYGQSKHRWAPAPKNNLIVPTLYGFKIIVSPDSDQVVSRSIYYNGTYEAGTLYVLSKCLAEGNTYFDIGSNIGLMALYASKYVGSNGKVLAFEPEPETFKILKSNIQLNQFSNIEPLEMALGSSKETATIYGSQTNLGAASLIPSEELISHGSTVRIETLDTLLSERSIVSVQMMKIDVEGWELEVLKGGKTLLSRSDAPILCIECSRLHPLHNAKIEDLFTFVSEINAYQIFRLARGKERASKLVKIETAEALPRHDNIFCFLPCHKEKIDKRLFQNP